MGKQYIISLGREFGSGGHAIAEILAKELNIPMYDKNVLDHIAEEKGMDVAHIEQFDEMPKNRLFTRRVAGHTNSLEEHVAEMQFEYIKKKADSGESFIIVGRCAETALKDRDGLISIFVLGDRECKIGRIMERYSLSREEAMSKMNRCDKKRKQYHNHYSDHKWGDSRTYDLCVNSSRLGVEKTAEMLLGYIKERTGESL